MPLARQPIATLRPVALHGLVVLCFLVTPPMLGQQLSTIPLQGKPGNQDDLRRAADKGSAVALNSRE
jgi:hypothetical protein